MKSIAFFLFILTMSMPVGANSLIQKPGLYVSDQKTSTLSIQATETQISFNFKHTEKDGRSCGTSGVFNPTVPWAFMLEGEKKIWIYKEDGKVIAKDFTMDSGPQVSVTSGATIFQLEIESDRNSIPKELLDFITNKPNQSPDTTPSTATPAALPPSRQP